MNAQAVTQVAKFLNVAPNQIEERMERLEREQEERGNQAEAMAAKINDMLPVSHCVQYSKLFSAAVQILQGEATLDEVVAQLSSKKVIIKK